MVDDFRLIELVEENDLLYNRSNLNYKNLERKKNVWFTIATELGISEDAAIKRYRSLRDRFVREKRMELLTGSESKYRTPLVDRMEFLTPHMFNRNLTDNEAVGLQSTYESVYIQSMFPDQVDYEETKTEGQYYIPAETKALETSPVTGSKRKAVEDTVVNNDANNVDYVFCDALRSFKKLCENREERKTNEALHGFGQMIIATIGGMSTEKQTRAMLRVTEVITQIKLESDD